jgi:hypothetical protein
VNVVRSEGARAKRRLRMGREPIPTMRLAHTHIYLLHSGEAPKVLLLVLADGADRPGPKRNWENGWATISIFKRCVVDDWAVNGGFEARHRY